VELLRRAVPYWGARLALASDPDNGIQRRINECRALNKPTYAGEVGVTVDPSPAVLKPP
jgi:hypothetical protein